MNIDFHYYLTYLLAERAGFDRKIKSGETEAEIIAYSSQYVDDNNESQGLGVAKEEPLEVVDGEMKGSSSLSVEINPYRKFPWAVRIGETQNYFRPIMTQVELFKSFDPMFQNYVFVPFHFLPGDLERIPEIRGRTNPDSTTPNSRNAVVLLKDALESGNPYGIGIALHTFADTWSHQNFSGYRDDWNAVRDSIIPDIGHAEVFMKPDVISEKWIDPRLMEAGQEIDNRDRARDAAKEIFSWLSKYRNPSIGWEDIKNDFEGLLHAKDEEARIEVVKEMYPGKDLEYGEDSDKTWIYEALEYDSERGEVMTREGFFDSHWYRFQLAARRHLAIAAHILAGSSSVETKTGFVRGRHIKAEKE